MIELIKKNAPFLSIYFVFALSVMGYIASSGKLDGHVYINQFHSPFFDAFFYWSTKTVEWFSFVMILGILLFKGAKFALNGLFIYAISALVIFGLKRLVFTTELRPISLLPDLRLLPPHFEFSQNVMHSFPSGHTAAAFTLFCFIALISSNKKLGYLYGIIAVIIGFSRVYLSQHFFQDIVAGATVGVIITFVFYFVLDKIKYGKWALRPIISFTKNE